MRRPTTNGVAHPKIHELTFAATTSVTVYSDAGYACESHRSIKCTIDRYRSRSPTRSGSRSLHIGKLVQTPSHDVAASVSSWAEMRRSLRPRSFHLLTQAATRAATG